MYKLLVKFNSNTHPHAYTHTHMSVLVTRSVKNPPHNEGDAGLIPDQEDPLEKEMATHSSILTWKVPWTEEPGRLQSVGLQRVRHSLETKPPPPHINMHTLNLYITYLSLILYTHINTHKYNIRFK